MLAIYLILGFFIGSQRSKIIKEKSNNKEEDIDKNSNNTSHNTNTDHNNPTKHHNIKIRKKMKKNFSINSNSAEGIDPDKVSVDIKKKTQERNKSSPEPSFIALSILWAHYVAEQLGLLKKENPPPWQIAFDNDDGEILEKQRNLDISPDSWRNFLSNIIRDKSWTRWIKDPDEVKNRTLLAFEH